MKNNSVSVQTQTNENNENEVSNQLKNKIDTSIHKTIFNKSFVKNVLLDDYVVDNIRYLIGSYYSLIHKLIMIAGLFLIVFSNDLFALICLLNILFLDSISNIIMYDCPLTLLEKSYLGYSFTSSRLELLQNIGIMYTNSRVYDTQLEIIINVSAACIFKILCLCIMRYFYKLKV